jgi:hypothetical protein
MEAQLCFGFCKSEWKNLKEKLDSGDQSGWEQAIGIFERRIRERFLRCIEALIAADTKPDREPPEHSESEICTPGFAILALCCLLIETLQSFREKALAGTAEHFKPFLRRPAFHGAFDDEACAGKFVKGIRNGIFHEGETRKWVIWRDEPAGQIVARENNGFALNRTLFYDALKEEFQCYLEELRTPSNQDLRDRFKKKLGDVVKAT